MDIATHTLLIGVGATAATDLWALARRRWLGLPLPDWALVGRWFAQLPRGRFIHTSMADVPPVRGERGIGWTAHYLTGVAFAVLLVALAGPGWLQSPTPGTALAVGIGTVAAPFFVLQPGMGAGIAARRSARPGRARLHSLLMHAVFGLGLYASAFVLAWLQVR